MQHPRLIAIVANAVLVATIGFVASSEAHVESGPDRWEPITTWAPPAWFPQESADALWELEALDAEPLKTASQPRVRARAAFLADLDRGEVLYTHDADGLYPVASLTKLVSSLALMSAEPDLDQELCVTPDLWPTRSGARSKFVTGSCHEGWEYLGAAMVKSDNRGAFGLAPLSGLSYDRFLFRMQDVSSELRLSYPQWSDPSGLEDDNLASARDMAKAVVAVAAHPTLSLTATADSWRIERERGPQRLGTTNRLVHRYETLAAKTGYTDTARWCFATVVRTASGRRFVATVLGSRTKRSRFSDVTRMIEWAEAQDR